MKLWCYADRQGWGAALKAEAARRGHDARMFTSAHEPDRGAVFVHMHHHPEVRATDKAVMRGLALRPSLRVAPDYRSSVLYDDKAEQARSLARWMPETAIVTQAEDVERELRRIGLPLMSKCAEGAGSHNVRFLTSADQVRDEAVQVFGSGMRRHYRQTQCGYLLWQKFCPGNDYDFRVIAIGRERLILRRGNRSATDPRASGSNKEMPIAWPDTEATSVLDFANEFFDAEGFRWCGIDVVRDHANNRWVVLETTVGWPLSNMPAHRFASGRSCAEFWPTVMDEIEAGALC